METFLKFRDALAVLVMLVVLGIAAFLFFGPVVEPIYSHCAEPPPPDAGYQCLDYMPALQE